MKWVELSEEDKKKVGEPIHSKQEDKVVGDVLDQEGHRKSNFLLYLFSKFVELELSISLLNFFFCVCILQKYARLMFVSI